MRSQRRAGFESDRWYLDVVDVASGQRQTVFQTPDASVENFSFAADGRTILFTAQDRGVVNLYTVAYPSGTPRSDHQGRRRCGIRRRTRFRDRREEQHHRADGSFSRLAHR